MLQQNSEQQIEVWEQLTNQKKYIVNLLYQAIEKSNLNYESQQSTILSNDQLNLMVKFILQLWQEYLQMQIASKNEYFVEEYHNSFKSFVEFNEFYSSIIIQRDQRVLFEQQQVLQEGNNQQIVQQENQKKKIEVNEEYEVAVMEQRKQKVKDYVTEIEKKIDWLNNIIKQSGSAVSKEQNPNSEVSDKSLGLLEEQQRKENSLHNQEGQSSLIDSQILKQITVGDLQNVKKLLQQINQLIIENLSIQQELDDCKQEINQLQLKISELLITNTEKQLNLKIERQSEGEPSPNFTEISALYLKPKAIPYQNVISRKEYWNTYIKTVNGFLRQGRTDIKMSNQPMNLALDHGLTNLAYELYDLRNQKIMIAKIPNFVIEEYESEGELSEETVKKAKQYAQSRFYALVIAKQLANVYRQKTKRIDGAPPIFYVSPIIYDLDKPFKGLRRIYAETFINLPNCKWIKYSNNTNHVEKEFYYMSSFSHFTYEETEQELVVMDLQGKRNILSDPSIQTTNENINQTLKQDQTNQQKQGIGSFLFSQHLNCNQICQKLLLKNENKVQTIDNSKFFNNVTEPMYYICDICDEIKDISQDQYLKDSIIKCELCKEQEKLNDEVQCNCCKRIFKTPYEVKIKQATNINTCYACKAQCKNI